MRETIDGIIMESDLLALNASIEAIAVSQQNEGFAGLAAKLQNLSSCIGRDLDGLSASSGVDAPLTRLERRGAKLKLDFSRIHRLSEQISDLAREVTCSLHKEDVVSQVVVYSKQHAENLRQLVARIEQQKIDMDAAMAKNRAQISSLEDSLKRQLITTENNSRQNAKRSTAQIPLDHDDREMF